jgi:hypothetical protein
MLIKVANPQTLRSKPQLHSHERHTTYNGGRYLPTTTWVRSCTVRPKATTLPGTPAVGDEVELVFEVMLYYNQNRACTIYRSLEDFVGLRKSLMPWNNNPPLLPSFKQQRQEQEIVHDLHVFLCEVLAKYPFEMGVEHFLQRRMDDCGGRWC